MFCYRCIKDSGNEFFKSGNNKQATRKYKKCSKYISVLRDTIGRTDEFQEARYGNRNLMNLDLQGKNLIQKSVISILLY